MVRFGAKKVNSRSPFFFWGKTPGWRAATAARRFLPSQTLVHLFFLAQISGVASCDSSEAFPTLSNACSSFLLQFPGEAATNITRSRSLIYLFPQVLQPKFPTQTLIHLFYFTLRGGYKISRSRSLIYLFPPVLQPKYPTLSNSRSPFLLYSSVEAATNITRSRSLIYLFPRCCNQSFPPSQTLVHLFFWPKSPGWRAAIAARRFPPSRTLVHLMSNSQGC